MTIIELWYFIALIGAALAGAIEGYKSGNVVLALLGAITGLVIAVGTICGSVLPNLIANRLSGLHRFKTDDISEWVFRSLVLLFTLSIFATPVVACWLTTISVQWIGSWWLT